MASKLRCPPDPLPLRQLPITTAPLPFDPVCRRPGCFGVSVRSVCEIVGEYRGPCNPSGPLLDALVGLVPLLHRPSVGPVLCDGHLRLGVDGAIAADVFQGEGLTVAHRDGPRRLVLLVCRHPYKVWGGIVVEGIQDQGKNSGELDLRRACLLPTSEQHGRTGLTIGEEAIQLHGGIGMTDELNIGHYVKRLMMINTTFGDGDFHQKKFNQLSYSV